MKKNHSLLSKHAKSFNWAGFFLSKEAYQKLSTLYSFCRTLDDICDQDKSLSFKKKQFKQFKHTFKTRNISKSIIKNFLDLTMEEGFSENIILDLFDGVETDLKKKIQFKSKKDLFIYSYRVAGTVGLMMAKIFRVNKKKSLIGAINLGIAMQLTNIARDVIEDKKRNRFYINHDFRSIKETIEISENLYSDSFESIKDIPIYNRFAILVARRVYRQIGREILKKRNIEKYNFSGKIYVSKLQKCIQTILAIFDFFHLMILRRNIKFKTNLLTIINKEINLNERL